MAHYQGIHMSMDFFEDIKFADYGQATSYSLFLHPVIEKPTYEGFQFPILKELKPD